jgi:hypothetical protein
MGTAPEKVVRASECRTLANQANDVLWMMELCNVVRPDPRP